MKQYKGCGQLQEFFAATCDLPDRSDRSTIKNATKKQLFLAVQHWLGLLPRWRIAPPDYLNFAALAGLGMSDVTPVCVRCTSAAARNQGRANVSPLMRTRSLTAQWLFWAASTFFKAAADSVEPPPVCACE